MSSNTTFSDSSLDRKITAADSGDSTAEKKPNRARKEALKISGIYLFVGCLWILSTDMLQGWLFEDHSGIVVASALKGLLYVLITAVLVYVLVYRSIASVLNSQHVIEKINRELERSNRSYKEVFQELERKQALLKSLMDSIPDFIFYKDGQGIYQGCNKAFERFLGKREDEIIGRSDFELFGEEKAKLYIDLDERLKRKGGPVNSGEAVSLPGGREAYLDTVKSLYYDTDGSVIGIIGVSRDISEHKNRENRIRCLSYHDVLTGLYNRTFFLEAQARLDREEFYPLSLISGDVNGMKLINDAFGHVKGDGFLKQIAAVLTRCSRPQDVVARVGGDEFLILLPKTDLQMTGEIVEEIRTQLKKEDQKTGEIHPDIALGYATKEDSATTFDKIMILAEDLMYRRKLLEQKSLHSSILASIKTTMFEKSNETEEHAERMAKLSRGLGKAVGFPESKMNELELLAMLHDIGKISVDRNILTKAGPLIDEEWREMKKHPEAGCRIANSSPELQHIAEGILCHHERWDGTGYPQGLAGENIPLMSRIISITDSYDAMTQNRVYRRAMPREAALAEIARCAGTQFDPNLVKAFLQIMADQET